MKFFRWSKYLVEIIKDTYKKHPIRIGIFFTCVLLLIMVEGWDYFAPLPAHDWIATNLRKIRVRQVNNFCFAVLGDNKNSHNTFQVLLQHINRDPDIVFAIDLGDLVFDGEKEKYRYFFDQVRASLQLPLLTVIGNHELREKGRGLYYDIFGPFYYFVVLDNANEVGLDRGGRGNGSKKNWKKHKGVIIVSSSCTFRSLTQGVAIIITAYQKRKPIPCLPFSRSIRLPIFLVLISTVILVASGKASLILSPEEQEQNCLEAIPNTIFITT